MSGGVDSSSAAALLKNQDFQVKGLFLRLYGEEEKTLKNIQDVEKVCQKLDIPLQIKDVRPRFKKEVMGYFLEEYASGRTPNPCVFCNENFKFKILLEEAKKAGIDYVATGHYARITKIQETINKQITNYKLQITNKFQNQNVKLKTVFRLRTAKDKNKDQSYFLYRLGQKELARIIFPLGEYEKTQVRALAKTFGLAVSEKKESQDVCFMAGVTLDEFLKKNLKLKKGKIVDATGKILGIHHGLPLYTIGQRKGIHIGGTGPYYVVAKDLKKNILTVSNDLQKLPLFYKVAILEKVSWVSAIPPRLARVLARSRYRNPLVYAIIKKHGANNAECEIEFEKPEKALASGQSVVFYAKTGEVIGGGVIA